jgi:p-cymene monooxygenase electron transfer component
VAGQYANVRSPNVVRPRCYSFADAPDRNGRKVVNFMIRRVPGGGFTDALFSGRLEGVRLEIEAPMGSFFLRTSAHPMICVAGGSGLAPLLSILEDARRMNVRRRCAVLFGARTTRDLYALDRLRDIQAAWLGGFEFIPILSAEPAQSEWTGRRGMVTELIASALPDPDWSQVEGYMCGPPGMIDAAIDVLTGLGTGLGSIHYDKFTDESHVAAQI